MARNTAASKAVAPNGDIIALKTIGRSRVTLWKNLGNFNVSVQKGVYNAVTKTWTNPTIYVFDGNEAIAIGQTLIKAGHFLNEHQPKETVGGKAVSSFDELLAQSPGAIVGIPSNDSHEDVYEDVETPY